MRRWFLPDMPDVLGLLRDQARTTRRGLDEFVGWADGASEKGQLVRDAEHDADGAKRAVQTALRNAFSTPLDPEDIYELSERTDSVMNAVKNIVREAEVLAASPDAHMSTMAAALRDGQVHLCEAIEALGHDDDRATRASDDAVANCREVEHVYRAAMSDLLALDDLREVIARRELYRRFSRAADAVELVAERVWYAVVKSA
jgi:hypothetical protein